MTQTEKDALESVYSKLYESALQLDAALNSGGYECDWGWYNHGVDPNTGDDVKTFISRLFLTASDDFRVCVYMPGAVSFNEFRALLAEFAVREEETDEE